MQWLKQARFGRNAPVSFSGVDADFQKVELRQENVRRSRASGRVEIAAKELNEHFGGMRRFPLPPDGRGIKGEGERSLHPSPSTNRKPDTQHAAKEVGCYLLAP